MAGKTMWRWPVAVVVLLMIAAVVLYFVNRPSGTSGPGEEPPRAAHLPPLAVKIDNLAEARPQTGIGVADVVYVEPVEGGLTRLMALYFTKLPPVIGPVRSARASDLGLLPEYGRPALAYSGAAPELLPSLHSAALVNASPAEAPTAFFRDDHKPAPHNLYVHPEQLPRGDPAPDAALPVFGATPANGTPATNYESRFPSAKFGFQWQQAVGRWQVSVDGKPLTTTDTGQASAATVVEQRVAVRQAPAEEGTSPAGSPIAETVGTGDAVVLRDGQRFSATWSRAGDRDPTRFLDQNGKDVTFSPGPVWILLVPR